MPLFYLNTGHTCPDLLQGGPCAPDLHEGLSRPTDDTGRDAEAPRNPRGRQGTGAGVGCVSENQPGYSGGSRATPKKHSDSLNNFSRSHPEGVVLEVVKFSYL
jgi:hypothetical protein